jgi:hypothetical protein
MTLLDIAWGYSIEKRVVAWSIYLSWPPPLEDAPVKNSLGLNNHRILNGIFASLEMWVLPLLDS